jgi:hypothetical protein
MSHAAEYRLINTAVAEQRSQWWSGHQACRTVPTFIQEEPSHERARTD